MSGQPRVADLLLDPVLDGATTVAGSAGVERLVDDVHWYDGRFEGLEGNLVLCGEAHVTPSYRLEALVRRVQQAGAAALLVVGGGARPLLSSIRLADRLEIPVLWLQKGDPVDLLMGALENARPKLEVKSRRVGGATYQVPVEISFERQESLALRWIVDAATSRKGIAMREALASEIIDAYNNTGTVVKKKEDTHKMAQANRAFAHLRW